MSLLKASRRVTLSYTGSVEHELRALRLHWRVVLRPWVRALARVMGVLISAVALWSLVTTGPNENAIVLLILTGCGFVMPMELRRRRRLRYRASVTAGATMQMTFSDNGVEAQAGELVKTSLAWPVFTKLVRSPDGYLLYAAPQAFFWIPLAAFAEPRDRLIADELFDAHLKCPVTRVS